MRHALMWLIGAWGCATVTTAQDLGLRYEARYVHQLGGSSPDEIMGVEHIGDDLALICSNTGVVLADLNDLPPQGSAGFLARVTGHDAYSSTTRSDGYSYVNLRQAGLLVLRVETDADEPSLQVLDEIAEPGVFYEKMTVVGDRLYVPAHQHGLRVFDVTNPAQPDPRASLATGLDDAYAVAVQDQTAYVADGAGGLKIVDLSDEQAPIVIGGENPATAAGTAQDVCIVGEHVYVAAGGAGVAVYPRDGHVTQRRLFDTPGSARDLAVLHGRLGVADTTGVVVFDIDPDGGLTRVAGEQGQYLAAFSAPRTWSGVTSWGDTRIAAANWNTVDVYELVDRASDDQPDITASAQRIRFAPDGGTAVIELRNDGSGPLVVDQLRSSSSAFSLSLSRTTITPGQTAALTVTYAGPPSWFSTIEVFSNDPDESPLPIRAMGATPDLDPGEPAIPFALDSWTYDRASDTYSQHTFDLAAHAGRIVYFQIYGSWCPACMYAVADVENTVVKTFADEPRIVTAILNQREPVARVEEVWRNFFLRGQSVHDPDGAVAREAYAQPATGLPFGRWFILDRAQFVVTPAFGHNPQRVVDELCTLLRTEFSMGDLNGDDQLGFDDFGEFAPRLRGPGASAPEPTCNPADFDEDRDADLSDVAVLQAVLGG